MEHETIYAATSVEKLADEWQSPGGGAAARPRTVISERIHVVAGSMAELIQKLGEKFFLAIDDAFIGDQAQGVAVEWFSFNRLETDDSDEPDRDDMAAWERGEAKLWLCDYTFTIEKRTVTPVPMHDFQQDGIKTH